MGLETFLLQVGRADTQPVDGGGVGDQRAICYIVGAFFLLQQCAARGGRLNGRSGGILDLDGKDGGGEEAGGVHQAHPGLPDQHPSGN